MKREPPPRAREILDTVRLLKPGLDLPSLDDRARVLLRTSRARRIARIFQGEGRQAVERFSDCRIQALHQLLQEIPDLPLEYILFDRRVADSTEPQARATFEARVRSIFVKVPEDRLAILYSLGPAADRYEMMRAWYVNLYRLALAGLGDSTTLITSEERSIQLIGPPLTAATRDGLVTFESDGFIEAFSTVPASRIRLCKICGRVFWAARKDMKGCTKACANALRARNWRENTTAEARDVYNKARRNKRKGIKGKTGG